MSDPVLPYIPAHLPEGVRRILVWSALGCTLINEQGRWRLERPSNMIGNRGPAPKRILETTARAAIAAGARVAQPASLFDAFDRVAA